MHEKNCKIEEHQGFELVETPNGVLAKLAYGTLYNPDIEDLEIELERIGILENELKTIIKERDACNRNDFSSTITVRHEIQRNQERQREHYKNCISILSRKISEGWNRWSEEILTLFLNEKIHKVCWGSGNCGKSIIFAMLIYIKWRVNPSNPSYQHK